MRPIRSAFCFLLIVISLLATISAGAHAAPMTDDQLCPGTGAECIVDTKFPVYVAANPEGIDVRPLTLHVVAPGDLFIAPGGPALPLTIRAGKVIVDAGASISGLSKAADGNTIIIVSDTDVSIDGTVQASAVQFNGTGGNGGSITIRAQAGACEVSGKVVANGAPNQSTGGNGGDVTLDCRSLDVNKGALVSASGAGPGGIGGNVTMTTVEALNIMKRGTVSVLGAAMDGGSISLSTVNGACTVGGKLLADAVTKSKIGGAGGNIDIICGGAFALTEGAAISLNGLEGGGTIDTFTGSDATIDPKTAIKANGASASGGTVDITAANAVTIGGKIETRAGGFSPNDGTIAVTTGGDLTIAGSATLNVSAGRKDLQTGQIVLADGDASPVVPHLTIESKAMLKADGAAAGFGAADIDLSGRICTFGGKINAAAQIENAPAIAFSCDSVTFKSSTVIKSTTTAGTPTGATGGSLTIDTVGDGTGTPGAVVLDGLINLQGTSKTVTNKSTGVTIIAPGHGGRLDVTSGAGASLNEGAVVDVSSGGPQSVGGQLSLSAAQPVHIAGKIKAKASGKWSQGGRIAVGAPEVYFDATPGGLEVTGETAGVIEVTDATGAGGSAIISVAKSLNAKGGPFGGNVVMTGCDVTIAAGGWLRSDGAVTNGGTNWIRAGKQLKIMGKVTALNGANQVSLQPSFSGTGTINPAPSSPYLTPPACP